MDRVKIQNKVKLGLFAFASLTDPSPKAESEYHWWHSSDHMADNLAAPDVHYGARYVASPELMAMRSPGDPALAPARFLISYYLGGDDPMRTLHDHHELNRELRELGREFPRRKIHFIGPFNFVKGYVASRLPIAPEALLWRPHTGVHVIMAELGDRRDAEAVGEWYDKVHLPDIISLKGFAGVWRFVSSGAPPYAGFANPPERFIHIYFLDGDPASTIAGLRAALPKWAAAGRGLDKPRKVVFAGGFRSLTREDFGGLDRA